MSAPLVRRFERNDAGQDYIVGDVHGHFSKLMDALKAMDFDPAVDRLFSVGDLVDRGPESLHSIEWLEHPWFHAVRGNHEDMAIRFPHGNMDPGNYRANGGEWNIAQPQEDRQRFSDAFAQLPVAIELKTANSIIGIVHAECPHKDWLVFTAVLESGNKGQTKQTMQAALWARDRIARGDETPVRNIDAVVVGHTPLKKKTTLGNTHYIDTGGWAGYEFTIINAATL